MKCCGQFGTPPLSLGLLRFDGVQVRQGVLPIHFPNMSTCQGKVVLE
jgi:hypothetical protein